MLKNILYLAHSESYYTNGIKYELSSIGENIDCFFFNDVLTAGGYYQIHSLIRKRIVPKRFQKIIFEKTRSLIDFIKSNNYDLIFVNSVLSMPYYFFEELKQHFKNVPIISYNWSSIKKYNFLPYQDCFTKIYSFDPEDCEKNGFEYLPMFYLREFESIGIDKPKRYDISFVGSAYSPGRLNFFNKLAKSGTLDNVREFFYLIGSSKFLHTKTILKYPILKNYMFVNWLPTNEVLNTYSYSFAMIDFPMSIQSGLTIRCFESLAAGLDLYTTNDQILKEPFYDPSRIHIVDSETPKLDFITKENKLDKVWQDEFRKYRIDNWVKNIFSDFSR